MNGKDLKNNADICKIIRQHLSEEQIEKNYQEACKKILPKGIVYDPFLMSEVTKECRKMALQQVPVRKFNMMQRIFIKTKWGISI